MKRTIFLLILFSSLIKQRSIGQEWSNFGAGIDFYTDGFIVSGVYSMASYNGSLYAGGFFYSSGGVPINNIARWDGANWLPLGQGVWGNSFYSNSWVTSMAVYNGELHVAGGFGSAGSVTAKNIAKWNGSTWSALAPIECGPVSSLAVFNNDLYVLAYFPTLGPYPEPPIAKWNGSNWSTVGTGLRFNRLYCMTTFNGALYVAGDSVNDGGGTVYHSGIGKWDGNSWTYVSLQINGPVYAMTEYNGDLYAAGQFSHVGDTLVNQIARWNGSGWSTLGAGIGMSDSWYTAVSALAVYDGSLYAGGVFYYAGGTRVNNIARWDGSDWHIVGNGTNQMIYALINYNSSIVAGGVFDMAGNVPANKIAKWLNSCTATPPPAGTINGERIACNGKTHTYSITPVNGAADYIWTIPTGWTGSSTTNTITVTAGPSGGTISVTPRNSCGLGMSQTANVSVINSPPAQPGLITGNSTFCENSFQTFSISPVAGAANYTWDCPNGWGYGSQSINSNMISFYIGINSGTVSVTANNSCGSSDARVLPVTVTRIPPRPGIIQGDTVVCEKSSQLFRVDPVPGANSYTWTLPAGWTGSSNTTSIITTPSKSGGRILVRSTNHCGSSGAIGKDISVLEIPGKPDSIVGLRYVTAGQTAAYITTSDVWATGHIWSVSGSGTIISGQNSQHPAVIRWDAPGIYTLSVKATNSCGTSIDETTNIHVSDPSTGAFDLRISPNLSPGTFILYAKQVQGKKINIKVMNSTGQEVLRSGQLTGTNDFSHPMYLHRFAAGSYIVKIWIDDELYIRRIVKMNQ